MRLGHSLRIGGARENSGNVAPFPRTAWPNRERVKARFFAQTVVMVRGSFERISSPLSVIRKDSM
jgi:hypothetical protein